MLTWITDKIATAGYSELDSNIIASGMVVDVRELVDKKGNSSDALLGQINKAKEVLDTKGTVYITCDMGISRSRVIAMGLMVKIGWDLKAAYAQVKLKANKPEINLPLYRSLVAVLSSKDDSKKNEDSILALGGGGFIGKFLKASLTEVKLHAPTRSEIDLSEDTIELSQYIEDHGCKTIIYLAHPKSYHSTKSFAASLAMLKNTLEVALEHKLKFIYLSSMVVFQGNAKKDQSFIGDESIEPIPLGTYSESKYFGEKLVQLYGNNYGLQTSIIRSSGVYGLDMSPTWLIPKLIKKATANEPIVTHEYNNGLPTFELIHVQDLCEGIKAVLLTKKAPAITHLTGPDLITTNELAKLIVRLTNSRSEVSLAKINDVVFNTKSKSLNAALIGWKPKKNLEEGLKGIISSMRGET